MLIYAFLNLGAALIMLTYKFVVPMRKVYTPFPTIRVLIQFNLLL
jgi:hypothetical protein